MEKSHAAWEVNGHAACPETSCHLGNTDLLPYFPNASTKSRSTPICNVLLLLALLTASKKIDVGVNTEIWILLLSCEQNGETS